MIEQIHIYIANKEQIRNRSRNYYLRAKLQNLSVGSVGVFVKKEFIWQNISSTRQNMVKYKYVSLPQDADKLARHSC